MSDLISREKTLYRLATSAVYYFDLEEDQAAHGWAMHIVSGMPDEEPDRKRGKWIDAEIPLESGGSMPIQVCNLCKTFYPLAYTGGGHRFCPNCGAQMKGADDED